MKLKLTFFQTPKISTILPNPTFAVIRKQKQTQLSTIPNCNSTPTSKYIYGNTVAIITWHENPFAIVIREPAIAKFEKQQFELIWKQAKTVRR